MGQYISGVQTDDYRYLKDYFEIIKNCIENKPKKKKTGVKTK